MKRTPLTIELVPKTAWYGNVRSQLSKDSWDAIRKKCYKLARYRCEICGASGIDQGFEHPVECHEIWLYDEASRTQVLKGFISLCPKCHMVKHFGRTQLTGKESMARSHMKLVNGWADQDVQAHIDESFARWQWRNRYDWALDINFVHVYVDEPHEVQQKPHPDSEIW